LKPENTVFRHRQTVGYFKTVLADRKDSRVVVVGHHAPTFNSVHEKYRNEQLMNGGYASDLSEFILDNPQIVLWTHGHMHDPCDYMVGTTRVVCNPRGYAGHDAQADVFQVKFLEI
jgi:Icc-related predicted phosphoesterase